jgi:hypothetical protein
MKRASFAMVLVSVVGAASPISHLMAQGSARFRSQLVPRISVGGAFDARNNGRGDDELYLGLATLEWHTGVRGLALRADGLYARRDWVNRRQPLPACDPTCAPGVFGGFTYSTAKVTAAGAMLGATYDVLWRGAFRPYVLASGGVIQTHDRFVAGTAPMFECPTACILTSIARAPDAERNVRPVRAAAQVGAGASYSIRWVSVFAEARYMTVDYPYARGLNGAVPVSLGFSVGQRGRRP